MTLILMARTLRRQPAACPRTVCAERLTPLGEPWAPLTTRLCQALALLGLTSCGEGGICLAAQLAISSSPTSLTILRRRLMVLPPSRVATITELAIDAVFFPRSRRGGTILVALP